LVQQGFGPEYASVLPLLESLGEKSAIERLHNGGHLDKSPFELAKRFLPTVAPDVVDEVFVDLAYRQDVDHGEQGSVHVRVFDIFKARLAAKAFRQVVDQSSCHQLWIEEAEGRKPNALEALLFGMDASQKRCDPVAVLLRPRRVIRTGQAGPLITQAQENRGC